MKYFQIKLCCQRKYYWGSYVKKFFCSATFFNMSKTEDKRPYEQRFL